jgi:hypothetical protein
LVFDGVDVQFIAALKKESGQTRWLEKRQVNNDLAQVLAAGGVKDIEKTLKEKPNDNRKSYATPTIVEHNGQKQLISPAAEATFSYVPQTGEELWRVCHQGWGWNVACRPIYDNGLVFFSTGVAKIYWLSIHRAEVILPRPMWFGAIGGVVLKFHHHLYITI